MAEGGIESLFPRLSEIDVANIETEANNYFKKIYSHASTIDEALETLKRFKDSSNLREKEVFNCIMKNLFEEYKYFHTYPVKELYITAQLFGGIIECGLITYMALGLALKYVLDGLRKPAGSKMYQFGIATLDRFRTRLKEYPQYSNYLATIPHFQEFPAHLIEYIQYAARSQRPPNQP